MSSAASHPVPDTLQVGLKEWARCCSALDDGSLMLAVRKGGIHERNGGLFTLEHRRFLLIPTYLHQHSDRLRQSLNAPDQGDWQAPRDGLLTISNWAEAVRIWKVTTIDRVLALGDELAWNTAELGARFAYRNQPWLFVVAVRVHRLTAGQRIPDLPRYAGCVSWVELESPIQVHGSRPVLDDEPFSARLAHIATVLDAT